MSFYDFRIGNFRYELLPVDVDRNSVYYSSLTANAHAFSLQRYDVNRPLENNVVITTLVGEKCIDDVTKSASEIFISVSPCFCCVTDEIAEARALQYLNAGEYKKL